MGTQRDAMGVSKIKPDQLRSPSSGAPHLSPVGSALLEALSGPGFVAVPQPLESGEGKQPGLGELQGVQVPWLVLGAGPGEDAGSLRVSQGVRLSLKVALLHLSRFLMRVLDSYGDDYRAGQFTFVLEVVSRLGGRAGQNLAGRPPPCTPLPIQDEGSQGTDAPTPSNTENEPPEKDGPSPPRRTPVPRESSSPAPGEGSSGRKRRRAPRDGRRGGASLTPELAPVMGGTRLRQGLHRIGGFWAWCGG